MSEPTVDATARSTPGADPFAHLGVWRDEHDDVTRRFFSWEIPAPDPTTRGALASVADRPIGLDLADVARLADGDLELETGTAPTPTGGLCVAVRTWWPGGSGALVDWWMGWHLDHTNRYKLWHPQAHVWARSRFARSDTPGLSDRDRYVGNTAWVDEYVGPFLSRLAIRFVDPAEVGLDAATMASGGFSTAVTGEVSDRISGQHLSWLVHAVRDEPDGCTMRSRFVFPPGTPDLVGPALADHCWTEMTQLAGFLPDLHATVTSR